MLILKNLGIEINYVYSLKYKNTARCPEQSVGKDLNGNLYLIVCAKTETQLFYVKRAIDKQKEIGDQISGEDIMINCPIFYGQIESEFYVVYNYFANTKEALNDEPCNWIRRQYSKAISYENTESVRERIINDFLGAWPSKYHKKIKKLDNFKLFEKELRVPTTFNILFQHGDFTPNNILYTESGQLFLMDFEFATNFQPIGFDLYDYHYASDKIYNDIPYFKLNELKEMLVNQINQLIDTECTAKIVTNLLPEREEKDWAFNMIYNCPQLYNQQNAYEVTIEYDDIVYVISYELCRYKAKLNVWLRNIPIAVLNKSVDYIFSNHKNIIKIDIDNACSNIKNQLYNDNNWVVFLPSKREEIFERLNKKSRYNFNREKKHLEEQEGKLSFKKYDAPDSIPKQLFDTYFEWKKKSHGTDYKMTGLEYCQKYHITGAMSLTADQTYIAVLFYCSNIDSVYFENISYNAQLAKWSPGIILYEYFLEEMTSEQKKYIFLGNGNQSYKSRFESQEYLVYTGSIYRNKIIKFLNVLEKRVKLKQ